MSGKAAPPLLGNRSYRFREEEKIANCLIVAVRVAPG